MRNRIQLSCVECRRKKKKCNRLTPCERCIKNNMLCVYTKNTEKSLEFSNQSEYVYREYGSSYYTINKSKRIDIKLFKLTYILERMVDFCHLDPRLNYIKLILESNELEKAVGRKFRRNELNMVKKANLKNYKVDPEIHNLIEFLVGMAFQFCICNPISLFTIQRSYLAYGLNSYLINCIAALMLPKYLLLRGIINPLPLKDNIFYIKALYLLNCSSTSKSEIALGAVYLFCFELNYGNIWSALVHFEMAKAACLELRLNMVDAYNQIYLSDQSFEICEKRNAWWCIMGIEVIMSLLYNFPINAKSDPKYCHIPHHLLRFNPSPYSVREKIENTICASNLRSIYQRLPHFNYLSMLVWIKEIIVFTIERLKEFYSSSESVDYRLKLLIDLDEKFEELVINNSEIFSLSDYKSKLKTEPSTYANASALFVVIAFNAFIMFYHESIFMAYIDAKHFKLAERYKLKLKVEAKSLFNFVINTMKLRNYPDPEIDLTQYYISSQLIPDIFVSLMKYFIPITTTEDSNQAQFVLELVSEFALYLPMSQFYSEWCTAQIKTNGRFSYTKEEKSQNSQIRILKIFEKSLTKDFFCQ